MSETIECQSCGEEIHIDEAVSGSGSVKERGARKLMDGETVGVEELFAFDEKYCSLGCATDKGEGADP